MSIESLMNSTCDVFTRSTSVDGAGGVNESYSDPARLLQQGCRIRELRGTERVPLGREGVVADYRIYFEGGTDIRSKDRITNIRRFREGRRLSTDTNNYRILFPAEPDRQSVFVQADILLIQQTGISTSG